MITTEATLWCKWLISSDQVVLFVSAVNSLIHVKVSHCSISDNRVRSDLNQHLEREVIGAAAWIL